MSAIKLRSLDEIRVAFREADENCKKYRSSDHEGRATDEVVINSIEEAKKAAEELLMLKYSVSEEEKEGYQATWDFYKSLKSSYFAPLEKYQREAGLSSDVELTKDQVTELSIILGLVSRMKTDSQIEGTRKSIMSFGKGNLSKNHPAKKALWDFYLSRRYQIVKDDEGSSNPRLSAQHDYVVRQMLEKGISFSEALAASKESVLMNLGLEVIQEKGKELLNKAMEVSDEEPNF